MIRRELAFFFGALRFFTRIPVPAWVGHSAEELNAAARYFPAVGLLIGLLAAIGFVLASLFWPKTIAVLVAMAITIYLTGAFHEDGWSDMIDGLGGGWERERMLAIMKDSRIGSFGAVALIMMLLGKFLALTEIDTPLIPVALIAGHAFSRLCATAVMRFLPYAREEGKTKPLATAISRKALLFALCLGSAPLLLLHPGDALMAVVLAMSASVWLARRYGRALGGYTGDCLGATQQWAELAFYLGLLCKLS